MYTRLLLSLQALASANAYLATARAATKYATHTISTSSIGFPTPVSSASSVAVTLGSTYFGPRPCFGTAAGTQAMYRQDFTDSTREQSIGFVYGCVDNANKLAAKVTFINKRRLKEVQARQKTTPYFV